MALTIQERLKDLRVECGLTLEQLAEQTHLSKSALGSYEAEDFKDISHYTLSSGETQTESAAQTGTVSTGMGNMGGQPGSFGGMQPPQNGGQPKSDSKVSGNFQPSDDFRPGDMASNNISAATATAQPGSGNSSGNAI